MQLAALFTLGLSLLASTALAEAKLQIGVRTAVPESQCARKTAKGDKLKMHYAGKLKETGEQFDSSYDRGTPFEFKLGAGQVIKGWDQVCT